MNMIRFRCLDGKNGACDGNCFWMINEKFLTKGTLDTTDRMTVTTICPETKCKIVMQEDV